jgi:hypothetical protein
VKNVAKCPLCSAAKSIEDCELMVVRDKRNTSPLLLRNPREAADKSVIN